MTITMDGQYALRKDPYTPVTILSINRGRKYEGSYPVISLDENGSFLSHTKEGFYIESGTPKPHDLVPLKQKSKSIWVNEYVNCGSSHDSKEKAIKYANAFCLRVAVEYREVVNEN